MNAVYAGSTPRAWISRSSPRVGHRVDSCTHACALLYTELADILGAARFQERPLSTRLFVSNLPLSATAATLSVKFGRFGAVLAVRIDGGTQRRGAFVEMKTASDAQRAIDGLNLADYDGRLISVYRALAAVGAPTT